MLNKFKELEKNCKVCTKCDLCKTRHNVVFGEGNINSNVMFIGEGPGANEDEQGRPFVGRAGMLLDKMLKAVDLDRNKNIYITNMVKCRPPQNRDPLPQEQKACEAWLKEQINLIDPKVIVLLGRIAAMKFIDENIRITRQHGEFFEKDGRIYMPTLHPAALLRNPKQKPGAFNDFLLLREKLKNLN